jgi:Icc-related predicted phosphoesterase
MKIQVVSDLHLEFAPIPEIKPDADVLILGGDICLAERLYRHPLHLADMRNNDGYASDAAKYREFFKYCSDNWSTVIYLAGNHEHYSGRWERTIPVLREETQRYHNILFCDQDRVDLGDVTFLGVSLWTDFNNHDPLTIMSARDMMNDYSSITENPREGIYHKLRPQTTLAKHVSDLGWLQVQLSQLQDRKVVVCSHHAPSHSSIHYTYQQPRYSIMNGAFVSNLDGFIMDYPQIKLFTHGHVHNVFDYYIGETRVVCNPRGYPGENSGWNPQFTVEV